MSQRGTFGDATEGVTAKRSSRPRLLLVLALTPFIGGGAHCGMTNYLGPVVHQDALGSGIAKAPATSSVRFRRARPDYRSAELTFEGAPTTTVRACDGEPRVFATIEGNARVPVRGICVEVVFSRPESAIAFEMVTEIDRQVVLQRNCSPHGGPSCMSERALPQGKTVGDRTETCTLWSIEVVTPAAGQ